MLDLETSQQVEKMLDSGNWHMLEIAEESPTPMAQPIKAAVRPIAGYLSVSQTDILQVTRSTIYDGSCRNSKRVELILLAAHLRVQVKENDYWTALLEVRRQDKKDATNRTFAKRKEYGVNRMYEVSSN